VETVLSPVRTKEDLLFEDSLRPRTFEEFVGQDTVKSNLKIFIQAARKRDEQLDHVLLYGPPGLGKTSLAYLIAKEMGVGIKPTSGPVIEQADKNQVREMVKILLDIKAEKLETDASDALAAAICHINSRIFQDKVKESTE